MILICALAYALADMLKNYQIYWGCEQPLIAWMAVSNFTLVGFRLLHFVGQHYAGIQDPPPANNINEFEEGKEHLKRAIIMFVTYLLLIID